MSHRGDLASHDHLDLLVSASVRFNLLVAPTTAAFSPATAQATVAATPTAAGRLLLEENLAALRWRSGRGRGPLEVSAEQLHYEHRPVARFELVEVIKAAHAYERLALGSPGWAGSAAHRLVDEIVHAATQRLPGYVDAAWRWTRPPVRAGVPIGLRRDWTPVERGVSWLQPSELVRRWDTAALVVLTVEALVELPCGLPARPGVYLCVQGAVQDQLWPAVTRLQHDVLVQLPAGRPWLLEQLADPAASVQSSQLVASSGRLA